MIMTRLAKMSRNTEEMRTTAAANFMFSSGVASEKMKMAMIRAE
jgi:hypothetical protein